MKRDNSSNNAFRVFLSLAAVALILILGYTAFASFAKQGDSYFVVASDESASNSIYLEEGSVSTKINTGSSLNYAPATNLLAFTQGTDGTGVVIVDLATMSQTEELLTLVINDVRYSDFYNPVWSPDGTRLAFSAYNYDTDITEVIVYSQEGSSQVVTSYYGYNISVLDWYDNNTVMFLEDGYYKQESTDSQKIYLANLSTQEVAYLATVHDSQPYSLDVYNGQIVYSTVDENGLFGIFTVIPGQTPVRIADGYSPVWSPDGTRIAYVIYNQSVHGDYQILVANSDGSASEVVYQAGPSWTIQTNSLAWSEDRLYFITSSPDTSSPTVVSYNNFMLVSISQFGRDLQVLEESNGIYEFVLR